MFETVIKFLDFLLKGIVAMPQSRKNALGRSLVKLHNLISDLVRDGQQIVALARKGDSDIEATLWDALVQQEKRILSIRRLVEKKPFRTVLSVHAPQLHPLIVTAMEEKGTTLRIHLATLEQFEIDQLELERLLSKHHYGIDPPVQIRPSRDGFAGDRLESFDEKQLRQAEKQMKQISSLNEKLRRFLAANFSIEEIL
jgi:hypothetical protein